MQVFISWSKEPSKTVAEALRDWLPDVIQDLKPWMSSADIGAGARWSARIAGALATTRIGILCVTPDNQHEPWLLFEAGALAKTLEQDTYVCPYLIQMRTADLNPGPLTQFQAQLADKEGTFELLSTINSALGAEALPIDRLRRLFERSWPDLEAKLRALPPAASGSHRSQEELLTEILETVRSLGRQTTAEVAHNDELQTLRTKAATARFVLSQLFPATSSEDIERLVGTLSGPDLDLLGYVHRRGPASASQSRIVARLLREIKEVLDSLPTNTDGPETSPAT